MGIAPSKDSNKIVALDPEHHRTLLQSCASGDRDAVSRFLEIYHPIVYSYLSRCGLSEAEIETAYKEVFRTALNEASELDASIPIRIWLLQVVTRAVRISYRTRKVKELVFAETAQHKLDELKSLNVSTPSNDCSNWLELAIKELRFALREVLLLSVSERLGERQIAAVLDLEEDSVGKLLQEARFTLVGALTRKNSQLNWESIVVTSPCFKMRELLISGGPETLQQNPSSQGHLIMCDECFSFLEAIAEVDSGLRELPPVQCDKRLKQVIADEFVKAETNQPDYSEIENDLAELTAASQPKESKVIQNDSAEAKPTSTFFQRVLSVFKK